MHPVILIFSFLIVAISLSIGGVAQLWLALFLLLFFYLVVPERNLAKLFSMLLRLRWLWISLLVVYLWFTPGQPLLEPLADWSPTWEGLSQGLWRVAVLLVIAVAAHLLMQVYSTEQIVAAIYWLAMPLSWVGISRDRFALRMMLVLELVSRVQPLQAIQAQEGEHGRNPLQRIGHSVAGLFQHVIVHAEAEPLREVQLPLSHVPPIWQWLFPMLLVCAFWWVGLL